MPFQDTFNTRSVTAMNTAFGVSITLTQGASTTAAFTATWEDQDYDVADAEDFLIKHHSRDFMFAVSDVIISAAEVVPRAGDVIAVTENSVAKKFEILPIGDLPAIERMPGGYRWLVHTKRVE